MGALAKQDNGILKQGAYYGGYHLFLTEDQAHKTYIHYTKQSETNNYTQEQMLTILNQFSTLVLSIASAKNYQAIEHLSKWLTALLSEATNMMIRDDNNSAQ